MNDLTTVTPPESLLKFDSALFVGLEPSGEEKIERPRPQKTSTDVANSQLEDMINAMLPPREWTEENGTWMQYTSKEPATRLDVITLQENLDRKLAERQARETGICAVREDLYSQTFDELIRQVTLDSPERGLLLLRVRDEIHMTIDAYKTLYESSVTFGVKKQLQAEEGMADMETSIDALGDQKKDLENQLAELRNKIQVIEKRENERRAVDEKKRNEEIQFLKEQHTHLDMFLKQLGANK